MSTNQKGRYFHAAHVFLDVAAGYGLHALKLMR